MTLKPLSVRLQSCRYRPTLFQWGLAAALLIVIAFVSFAGFYAYGNSDLMVRAVEWARDIVGPHFHATAAPCADYSRQGIPEGRAMAASGYGRPTRRPTPNPVVYVYPA